MNQRAFLLVLLLPILCIFSGVIGGAMTRHFGNSAYTISYADFVSIMLTAISLIMTLLAFFLAVLAFVGWTSLAERVRSTTEAFLDEGIKEGGQIYQILKRTSESVTYEGVSEFQRDADDTKEMDGQ